MSDPKSDVKVGEMAEDQLSGHVNLVLADASVGIVQSAGAENETSSIWIAVIQVYAKTYLFHLGGISVASIDDDLLANYANKTVIDFGRTAKTEEELNAYLTSEQITCKFAVGRFRFAKNNSCHFADHLLKNFFQFPEGVPGYALHQAGGFKHGRRAARTLLMDALVQQVQKMQKRRHHGHGRHHGCKSQVKGGGHHHKLYRQYQEFEQDITTAPLLRADMIEFINNAFPEEDEVPVADKVKSVLRREGYAQLSELSSTSEEELLSMGLKRGWAKRIVAALETYFK